MYSSRWAEVCNEPSARKSIKMELSEYNILYSLSKVTLQEIDEMIKIVDRNRDGRISYSEFR